MDASEVTFKKVELDYDDGMMQYEIELYTADREYDYDLNAQDGSILSWDFEALKMCIRDRIWDSRRLCGASEK